MRIEKPREFFISWIDTYIRDQITEENHLIVENPDADVLENNGVHVIEKSAYDKAVTTLYNIHKLSDNKELEQMAEKTLKELGEL